MRVPFLHSFPGNEAHQIFSGAPLWGVSGGGQDRAVPSGGFQSTATRRVSRPVMSAKRFKTESGEAPPQSKEICNSGGFHC